MDRGLRAQLSPNEESTLRRLPSLSGPEQTSLRPSILNKLSTLQLIEVSGGSWCLTRIGDLRVKRVLSSTPIPDRPK